LPSEHLRQKIVAKQGQKFVEVGAESRYLAFAATSRDIWHLPRQIAIISALRDKSRFLWYFESGRQIATSFTSYSQIPGILAF
jgi:hypothetical protein